MRNVKIAAVTWATVGFLLLVWFVFALGTNAGGDSEYEKQVAAAAKQEQFWRIVAGDGRGPEGALNKLAMDLREMEVEDLYSFRGDSNRYGGISGELGFDPFNGVNCSECGPLDPEVIETTVRVKNGELSEVLIALQPEKPEPPDGPSYALWFVWFLGWPVVLGVPYVMHKREVERRYADYSLEMGLVRTLNEAAEEADWQQQEQLQRLSHGIQDTVERRIEYGESASRSLRLEELMREAQETLDAMNEGNRALDQ